MHGQPEEDLNPTLAAGTCLGKYQVVRLIGEGGMGAVYEGVHLGIGKKVAIKIMSPELAANLDARARFLREGQLTSRVRHPHVIDVTDVGTRGRTDVPGDGAARGRGPGELHPVAGPPAARAGRGHHAPHRCRGGGGARRRDHSP
jgi:hypothetical protein